MTEETIPIGACGLYLEGLRGLQEIHGVPLNKALEMAMQDVKEGDPEAPLIQAAYFHLLGQETEPDQKI